MCLGSRIGRKRWITKRADPMARKSPYCGTTPSDRSEQLGRLLAISIEARNWDRCQAIIDRAKDEFGDPVGNPMELAVAELPLNPRCVNGLEEMGILMVEELLELTAVEILEHPNFGPVCLEEIQRALRQVGLGQTQIPIAF
jgi:DNA-directed RNA polymerase alpha subunit